MLDLLQFLTTANNVTISPVMMVVAIAAWKFSRDLGRLKDTVHELKRTVASCCYRPPAEPVPLHRRRQQQGAD